MQMKNRKRFLALVAAAAMVIAPCSAFATATSSAIDGMGGTGDGKTEGWVEKEFFQVEYPTIADGELDFIMDPQELIKAVGIGKHQYGSDTFEDGYTLFFKTGANAWTHYSKDYELKIWSTSTVEVSLSATVSSGSIEVCTDSAFTTSEKPSIYMGIETSVADDLTSNASPTFTLAGVVDPSTKVGTTSVTTKALDVKDDFVITDTDKNGGYKFELNPDSTNKARSIKFRLEGAANNNPEANWKDVVNVKPSVDLVWSVAPEGASEPCPSEPGFASTDYTFQYGKDLKAAVNLDGDTVDKVGFRIGSGAVTYLEEGTDYSFTGYTLTIPGSTGRVAKAGEKRASDLTVSLIVKASSGKLYTASLLIPQR